MVSKMNKDINESEDARPIKIFGMLLPSMPSLMFKFTGTFLRFKSQANKAGRVFNKELVKQGIDRDTAKELTDIYMESSHLRKYIQNLR